MEKKDMIGHCPEGLAIKTHDILTMSGSRVTFPHRRRGGPIG